MKQTQICKIEIDKKVINVIENSAGLSLTNELGESFIIPPTMLNELTKFMVNYTLKD